MFSLSVVLFDLNQNILTDHPHAIQINNLFGSLNALHSFNFIKESHDCNFSFSVPNRNAFSLIDFFLLSNNLGSLAISFDIVDDITNLSDHRPIKITFPLLEFLSLFPSPSIFQPKTIPTINPNPLNRLVFYWDPKSAPMYYESTRIKFQALADTFSNLSLSQLAITRPDIFSPHGVNNIYNNLIHGLLNASLECFKVKNNASKFKRKWWWGDDLRVAKSHSLTLFNIWKAEGSVINSPSFNRYHAAKKDFHSLIRKSKKEANSGLNDNLLNSLNLCNNHKFWNLWNANFNSAKSLSKYSFEGLEGNFEIANYLAAAHKSNCSPNSHIFDTKMHDDFITSKNVHRNANFYPTISISTLMVDKAIAKIRNNTTPGHDNICIEHFKLAHPSVILILKSLFNIFLHLGIVPLEFGEGVVTPIPKFKGQKCKVNADDFRGITLSPIASKIFEHSIHPFFHHLSTSDRQFGFKHGTGCAHALKIVRNSIQFFTSKGNTVNLGLIDIKKAFDKSNFWGILSILQNKHINPILIDILEHWFTTSTARVKWGDALSDRISLKAGVRQGSILSPLLFSMYIDIILVELEKSKLGCFLNGKCINSFLYADDLILLSLSISDLQCLIDKCKVLFDNLDLQINYSKSNCLRIGNRFRSVCRPITINGCLISWVSEAKYLGITLQAGPKLTFNWAPARRNFYCSLNNILSHLGHNPHISIVLSLFRSNCIPILSYGLSSLSLSKHDLNALSFAYNNIFHKLFKTNNNTTIESCQYFCNFWSFPVLHDYLRYSFLIPFYKSGNLSMNSALDRYDYCDLFNIVSKYNLNTNDSIKSIKYKFWKVVESKFR